MAARPVKAFRQGKRKDEPGYAHREHRSDSGRDENYHFKRGKRKRSREKHEEGLNGTFQSLNRLKQEFNTNPEARAKMLWKAYNNRVNKKREGKR